MSKRRCHSYHSSQRQTTCTPPRRKPMDRATASDPDSYSIRHFELACHAAYGTSPEKNTNVKPTAATLSEDGLSVDLKPPVLLPEKIYEFRVDGLRTASGHAVVHPLAFYTLNRLKK